MGEKWMRLGAGDPQQFSGPFPCPVSDARRNTAAGCLTRPSDWLRDIRDNEGRVFARQGEVMNPLQYVPSTRRCISSTAMIRAQVAWMKRQTPHTGEQNYPRAGQHSGDAEVSGQPDLL